MVSVPPEIDEEQLPIPVQATQHVDKEIEIIMPKLTDGDEVSLGSATPPPIPPQTELSLRYLYHQPLITSVYSMGTVSM